MRLSDDVDLEEVMQKIKENVIRRKLSSNKPEYTRVDAEHQKASVSEYCTKINRDLTIINNRWNINNDHYVISSHRKILGPFLVRGRRLVHGEVRRYVDPIFNMQKEFNAAIARIINETANEIDNLARKVDEIQDKFNETKSPIYDQDWYYLFEEKFRGSRELIKERFKKYLKYFRGCKNVLDIGCGRGEFLELLKEESSSGKGIDVNEDMVKFCQSRGLDVVKADALQYLESLEDKTLDGIFISHLAEHLEPQYLVNLLQLCYKKLKYGYYIVIISPNPMSLFSLLYFYSDPSHYKPLPPETLKFLLEYVGFRDITTEFHEDVPPELKLEKIDVADLDDKLSSFVETYNRNIEKLNKMLFNSQDYAVIGRK